MKTLQSTTCLLLELRLAINFVFFIPVCVVFSPSLLGFQKISEVKHEIYFERPYYNIMNRLPLYLWSVSHASWAQLISWCMFLVHPVRDVLIIWKGFLSNQFRKVKMVFLPSLFHYNQSNSMFTF